MIKVLMLVPSLRIGSGVASFAISYFRSLNHETVQLDFACYANFPESYVMEIENRGSKVFFLPSVRDFFNHINECRKILEENKYDIIHNCSMINTIPMMFVARHYVKKRVFHSHSSKFGETTIKAIRNRLFFPILCTSCNEYAACSDIAAKSIFGNRPYELIPNVIDTDKFLYKKEIREKNRNELSAEGKVIIGSVGRGALSKNPIRALAIFKMVHDIIPNTEYWWIGSGPLLQDMKQYAKKVGIEKNVKFLGNRDDVSDLYQAMDLFFMPSRFEGLGIACVEAQASGLQCVVSDVISSTVNYSNNVVFISLAKSNNYWAKTITDLLSEVGLRRSYKMELLGSVFSDSSAGERLENYYTQLLYKS